MMRKPDEICIRAQEKMLKTSKIKENSTYFFEGIIIQSCTTYMWHVWVLVIYINKEEVIHMTSRT